MYNGVFTRGVRSVPLEERTRQAVKILGILATGIAAIATPLLVLYVEYAPQIRATQRDVETGYETLAPAISEMKRVLNESQAWSLYADKSLSSLDRSLRDVDTRLARCEAYIDILKDKTRLPAPPPARGMPDVKPEASRASDPPVQSPVRLDIPRDIKEAKARAKKRDAADCGGSDPLCGSGN